MKPRIYLAGAINGQSDEEVFGWRQKATDRLRDCYEILDPSLRDYRGLEEGNAEEIVSGDLAEIQTAHVVLVRADRPSWGTAMEIRFASSEGKYVVVWGAGHRPSPWLVAHSSAILSTLDVALLHCLQVFRQHWMEVNA